VRVCRARSPFGQHARAPESDVHRRLNANDNPRLQLHVRIRLASRTSHDDGGGRPALAREVGVRESAAHVRSFIGDPRSGLFGFCPPALAEPDGPLAYPKMVESAWGASQRSRAVRLCGPYA
jgi:hypothetical protein